MGENSSKKRFGSNRALLLSTLITLIFLGVFSFSNPTYSSAGDGSLAKYLASNSEPGFYSLSVGIASILKLFVKAFTSVNWWTVFSMLIMFGTLFGLTMCIQRLFDGLFGQIAAVIFACFLWEAAIGVEINFTQTAIMAGVTGTSLLLMISRCKQKRTLIILAVAGILFILTAGALRPNAMILCIPFAAVVMFVRFVSLLWSGNYRKKDSAYSTVNSDMKSGHNPDIILRPVALMVGIPMICIVLSLVISYGSHAMYRRSNPDIAFFEDTFDLARETYDYMDQQPPFEEVKELYESDGLTASWYRMLSEYYIVDTNYFNISTMAIPTTVKLPSQKTFGQYMQMISDHKPAALMAVMALIAAYCAALVIRRQRLLSHYSGDDGRLDKGSNRLGIMQITIWLIPILAFAGTFIASGLYFVHLGRFEWRVSGGIIIADVMMAIFMLADLIFVPNQTTNDYKVRSRDDTSNQADLVQEKSAADGFNGRHKSNQTLASAIMIFSYALATLSMILTVYGIATTKSFSVPHKEITDVAQAGLLDYIDAHRDRVYLIDDMYYSCHNVWCVPEPNYLMNKFALAAGYNEGRNADLRAYGISDMSQFVMNMLTRPDIYSVYDEAWAAYLCDFYNPYVSAGIVDTFDETGTQFIRYVAPMETTETLDGDISYATGGRISNLDAYVDTSMQTDTYQVVRISMQYRDVGESDVETTQYYFNVENPATGAIYSYPLIADEGVLEGSAIWKNDTWNFMETRQYLVCKSGDTVVKVADLTGMPVDFR